MTKEIAIQKEASPLVEKAKALTIKKPADMEKASDMRSSLKKMAAKIDTEKNKVMRPLLDAVAAERARWAPAEKAIKEALSFVDRSMIDYQTEQQAIADEKAAKIEARIGKGKGKLGLDTAVAQIEDIDKPEAVITSEVGGTKFRAHNVLIVDDITKIPFEYLLVDESKLKAALLDGVNVKGAHIKVEQRPVNIA